MNYDEHRLREIEELLSLGIEDISPNEAKRLKKERDAILSRYIND